VVSYKKIAREASFWGEKDLANQERADPPGISTMASSSKNKQGTSGDIKKLRGKNREDLP